MNSRTQAGLEYLMTYGWALVLIAAAIGILVFIVGSPALQITFSSSDPTKILIKAGAVSGTIAEVQLHNVTGGGISITGIVGDLYSDCTIDGASPLDADGESSPISVGAGNQMTLECTTPADGLGRAIIDYSDFAGLQRTVIIKASGAKAGSETSAVCGNNILEAGEECDPPGGFWDCDACPFPLCEGYHFSENNSITVKKIASFSSKQDAMQPLSEKTISFSMPGFICSDSCTLINNGCVADPYCGDGECTGNESDPYSPEYCPEDCIVP